MPRAATIDFAGARRLWRDISPEHRLQAPGLRSRVQLDEGCRIVAIVERGGRFWLNGTDDTRSFPKLSEAEDFAAGWLLKERGVCL